MAPPPLENEILYARTFMGDNLRPYGRDNIGGGSLRVEGTVGIRPVLMVPEYADPQSIPFFSTVCTEYRGRVYRILFSTVCTEYRG